ncbi:hypothetical protein [Ornithinimicrobium kibberense]|uniref:hypothetical protein n=1 Tax=Ornithinimicrobium kibberense TaxID=282060 RepID=UPI00361BBC3C
MGHWGVGGRRPESDQEWGCPIRTCTRRPRRSPRPACAWNDPPRRPVTARRPCRAASSRRWAGPRRRPTSAWTGARSSAWG